MNNPLSNDHPLMCLLISSCKCVMCRCGRGCGVMGPYRDNAIQYTVHVIHYVLRSRGQEVKRHFRKPVWAARRLIAGRRRLIAGALSSNPQTGMSVKFAWAVRERNLVELQSDPITPLTVPISWEKSGVSECESKIQRLIFIFIFLILIILFLTKLPKLYQVYHLLYFGAEHVTFCCCCVVVYGLIQGHLVALGCHEEIKMDSGRRLRLCPQ